MTQLDKARRDLLTAQHQHDIMEFGVINAAKIAVIREEAAHAIADLESKIEWLLTNFELWADDDSFTFPDGETYHKPSDKGEQS